jgi:hypothetical protein
MKYLPKAKIKYILIRNNKDSKAFNVIYDIYDAKDTQSGVHYAEGGLTDSTYHLKSQTLIVDDKGKIVSDKKSGVWLKKSAKPVGSVEKSVAMDFENIKDWEEHISGGSKHKDVLEFGNTRVSKGAYGWTAKTSTKDPINGYDYEITTLKRYNKDLLSDAQGGTSEDKGGYKMFTYMMYQDPSIALVRTTPKVVNEKKVREQHQEALEKFKQLYAEGKLPKRKYAKGGMTTTEKTPMKKIVLSSSDGKVFVDTTSVDKANEGLKGVWKRKRYSDVYYDITFDDGFELSGSIDLEPHSFHKGHEDKILTWHLNTFWNNVARSDKGYISQEHKDYAKNIVDNYRLYASGGEINMNKNLKSEIEESISMGYNILEVGMISPKRKGVVLRNEDYKVRGTYPLELKESIQEIIDNHKFAKGGVIRTIPMGQEYRYVGSNSIEKDIMDRIKGQLEGLEFVGNFDIKDWKRFTSGYLYSLDDFDKNFVKDIPLKENERIFRYYTRSTAIGGMMPLVKINLESGLMYFNQATDFGDESIRFSRKGERPLYLNLVEGVVEGKFAKGGRVSKDYSVVVDSKVSKEDVNEFIDYCNEFYGKKGLYAEDLDGGFTREEIKEAVIKYLEKLEYSQSWGNGDSLDRERVREILQPSYSLLAEGGEMSKGNSMLHYLLNEASSGSIASHTPYNQYKDIDAVRSTAIQILMRDGDREYSLGELKSLISDAVAEYEENKYEMGFAKGGKLTTKDYERAFESRDYMDSGDFERISTKVDKEFLSRDKESAVHDKFTKYWYSGGREEAMAKYGDDENEAWANAYEDYKEDFYKMSRGGDLAGAGKFAKGGGVDRYIVTFNYNPGVVKTDYLERLVGKYTNDWNHDNDWDEVSFYVQGLTNEKANDLVMELKGEDVYNVELEKGRYTYAKGGKIDYYGRQSLYHEWLKDVDADFKKNFVMPKTKKEFDEQQSKYIYRASYDNYNYEKDQKLAKNRRSYYAMVEDRLYRDLYEAEQKGDMQRYHELLQLRKDLNMFANGGEMEDKMSYDEFVETLQEYEIEGGFDKTIEKGYKMYYLPNNNPYLNTKFNHRNKRKAYQEYLKMSKYAKGGEIKVGTATFGEKEFWRVTHSSIDDIGVFPKDKYTESEAKELFLEKYMPQSKSKGGKIGFKGLSEKVAKRYEGKEVPSKYQNLYGKRYDKTEAKEVGDKVAAKVYRQQLAKSGKFAEGGHMMKKSSLTGILPTHKTHKNG